MYFTKLGLGLPESEKRNYLRTQVNFQKYLALFLLKLRLIPAPWLHIYPIFLSTLLFPRLILHLFPSTFRAQFEFQLRTVKKLISPLRYRQLNWKV